MNVNQTIESASVGLSAVLEFRSGDFLFAGPEIEIEDLEEAIEFPENTWVPAGRYTFYTLSAFVMMHDGRLHGGVGSFF